MTLIQKTAGSQTSDQLSAPARQVDLPLAAEALFDEIVRLSMAARAVVVKATDEAAAKPPGELVSLLTAVEGLLSAVLMLASKGGALATGGAPFYNDAESWFLSEYARFLVGSPDGDRSDDEVQQ